MTTLLPEVAPPPPPDDPDALESQDPGVPPEIVDYRRRYRRRLVLTSLPFVVIVALVAVKLLSLPFFAGLAQATYDRGSYDSTVSASDGLGPVNVLEPWVRYFDRGTALGRIGVLVDSRSDLEKALVLVPASDVDASCRVRTDLVLIVEQQGDSAVLDQQYTQAEAFYAHALALYNAAPAGCFSTADAKNPPSKKPLQDAHGRLEQKQKQTQQQTGGGSSPGDSGQGGAQKGQGDSDKGQGGSSSGSSQSPLDQLQKRDDQAQQQEQQNDDRNRYFKQNPEQYSGKPW